MRFTLYIDRDVAVEAGTDREAALIAERVQTAVDELLAHVPGATVQYARTTCHRGERNKCIYDVEHMEGVDVG